MSSVLVVGQDHSLLAHHVAKKLNADIVFYSITQFADSETFLSLSDPEKIPQARIVLVYQFLQAGRTNDQLIGLFECIDHLKKLASLSISVLLPYLPYARQDESIYKNYDGGAFMVGRCLRALGAQSVYACDVHAISMCSHYPLPLHNFSLEIFWHDVIVQNIIQQQLLANFCIVSPDEGGRERVEKIAELLGSPDFFIRKTRVAFDAAVCYELVGDVQGKHVILIDDIIDTAHTSISACNLLLERGAERVYGIFSHAVLAPGAIDRIANSKFTKIFVTDTVIGNGREYPEKIEIVSINDYLAEQAHDLLMQTSIF